MGTARRSFSAVHPSDRSRIQKREGKSSPAVTRHQKPSSSSSSSHSSSSFSSRTGRTAAAGQVVPARQSGGSGKAAAVGNAAGGGAEEASPTFSSARRQEKEEKDTKTPRRGISCVSSPQVGVTGCARRSDGGAVAVAEDYRSSRLFVRGLPPFVSAAELKERFSSLGGEVTDVCLLVTEKGRSRQCAFVGFKTQAQAAAAKEYFDSSFFYTRRIVVEFALPKHAAATDAAAAFSSSRKRTEERAAGGARGAAAVAAGEAPAARASKKGGRTSTAAAAAETEGASGSGSSTETKPQQSQQKRSRRAGSGESGKTAAGGVIVEEEAVQAKKAGVGSVRKRLIFEDFFSSSDEEEEEAAGQQEGEGGGAVGGEGQGNSSSKGPPQQKNVARKRAKGCAETSAEAVGSGNESSSAAGAAASSERAAAGSDDAAAGVVKAAAAAAAENGKRGKKTSRGDGGEDAASAGVLDDMAWLRQQSAAAQAAATQAREKEREAGAGGAAAKTEGEPGEAAEGRRRDGGAGAAVGAGGGEAVAATTAEEGTRRKTEEALALLGVHGRLLLRNFPYATTQEELKALCEQHGEVAEVHVVHDEETRKSKGYAFVTFVFPEHAVAALAKLDGMIFQGRLLQTEAAQPDAKKELRQQQRERQAAQKGSSSSYKRKKQQELLQQHTENQAFLEEKVWNLLYVSANAAVDAVAREFQVDKEELLGVEQPGKKKADDLSAAAKVALAETHLLQATREWIVKEGISAKAFERRGPTLLAAGVATRPSSGAGADRSNTKEGDYGSNRETAATSGQRQRKEEEEEEASSMGRSRDTLIVKHLPTAHVVGAELLRMFEAVGTVVRFLLAPSKTVAIVQYEKERDAAAAFRRLAYRKYKTVPLFIEKAPVDIFVGEEEQRRHAQMEAAAEASAASHADALAAGRHTGQKGQSGVGADRRSREGEGEEGGVARGGDERQKMVVNGEAGGGEGTCTLGSKKKASVPGDRKRIREQGGKTGDAEDAGGCGVCTPRSDGGALPGSGEAAAEEEEEEHTDGLRGNSLFVKNLNFCTTEAALHEVFTGCTGLRSVKLMSKKRPVNKRSAEEHGTEDRPSLRENAEASSSGSNAGEFETLSLGYAFVEFDSAANAAAACKRMQGVVVDAHTLKISISKSAPQRRNNGSSLLPVGGAAAGARPSAAAAATANGRGTVKSRKLLVRNLAFQATTADLRGLFSAYGNVTRVCIPTQHEGRSRGFGFVEFATRPEAAAALQALGGTHLYGRKLVLEPALQETQGIGKN